LRKLALLLALLAIAGCNSLAARLSPRPDAGKVAPPPPPPPAPPADPLAAAGLERVSLTIEGPLEKALRTSAASDIAPALDAVTGRLLAWWVDLSRDLRKGDSLDIVFQRLPNHEPQLHALRFTTTKSAQEYKAYLYKPEGARFARFYDASGAEVEERLQGGPIDDYEQVTSMLRDGRRHKGVDFKAPVGTPVKAPFDLTLNRKNWSWRGNGNCLELKDAKGRLIIFLHLSELPKTLVPGQHFKAGDVLAQSGNTGHTTAPHLHYQLMSADGRLLDPFKEHTTFHARLDAGQMAGFTAAREKYDRMLGFVPGAPQPVAAMPAPAGAAAGSLDAAVASTPDAASAAPAQ
jgi:murein DD-endopeptidase